MKVDLHYIPLEAILLTKDYCKGEHGFDAKVNYSSDSAEIGFSSEKHEHVFIEELNDFLLRTAINERTKPLKEFIVGRALYGLIERANS